MSYLLIDCERPIFILTGEVPDSEYHCSFWMLNQWLIYNIVSSYKSCSNYKVDAHILKMFFGRPVFRFLWIRVSLLGFAFRFFYVNK
jgi:hypothetical protein